MVNTLKQYLYRDIEDYGGYTSPDYKTFERKYKALLKRMAERNGYELVKFSPMHYQFSCFFKKEEKYVYFSISDVRYWKNRWCNNILVRTAKSDSDYTGGSNCYTSLATLESDLSKLFTKGWC